MNFYDVHQSAHKQKLHRNIYPKKAIFSPYIISVETGSSPLNLDFSQAAVTIMLNAEHGVTNAEWPNEFNETSFELHEMSNPKSLWNLTLKNIQKVSQEEFLADMESDIPKFTYVLVYEITVGDPTTRHCVYAESVIRGKDRRNGKREHKIIKCINSEKRNPYPNIDLDTPNLKFFQVYCEAEAISGYSSQKGCSGKNTSESDFLIYFR